MSSRKERLKREKRERRARQREVARQYTRFLVSITSFNRPKMALDLLKQLKKESENNKNSKIIIDVLFSNDSSFLDYSDVEKFVKSNNWKYYKTDRNYGKFEHWRLYNEILKSFLDDKNGIGRLPTVPAPYLYVFLQDDNIITSNFFNKLKNFREKLRGKPFICNVFRDSTTLKGKSRWGGLKIEEFEYFDICHYVDGMFVTDSTLLNKIDWKIDDIPFKRWEENPFLSSGVGRQLTKKILKNELKVYMHKNSFVQQSEGSSVMNLGNNIKSLNFEV